MMKKYSPLPFSIPAQIQPEYAKWYHFMMDKIEFALKSSPIHTKAHASRVLLFALLIAQKRNLPPG